MATAVVSGRVDSDVKRRVDEILQREGKAPGDVIRDVWISIYETGKLPDSLTDEARSAERRSRFSQFMEFRKTMADVPEWLTTLDDAGMKELFGGRDA